MSSSSSSATTASTIAVGGGLALIIFAGVLNGSWNASFSPKVGWAVGRETTTVNIISVGRRATVLLLVVTPDNGTATATAAAAAAAAAAGDHVGEDEAQHINNNNKKKKVDLDYHFAWLLFQLYAALVNIPLCIYWTGGPERTSWIIQSPSSVKSIALVCIFSLLWGVGSVGFGLACKIAGMGLGTNLFMGVVAIAGTLLPLILQNLVATAFGAIILTGLCVCSIGLFFFMSSLQIRDQDEQRITAAAAKLLKIQESKRELGAAAAAAASDEQDIINDISDHQEEDDGQQGYSTFSKVLLCVVSGLFASMLQFAFVYGDPMIQLAASNDGPNAPTPETGTASIVWLFAFTISCPVSIIYGFVSSPKDIPLSTIWKCPWYRHILLFLTSAVPWVAHIHLYGIANILLPPRLAASVSWPVLMMTTVATGMIWSLGLGEWKDASYAAKRQLTLGLCTITAGIVVLMTSLTVSS